MKAAKIVANIIFTVIVMPIWWYLIYKILQGVNATELMWFLFWVYVPASLLSRVLFSVVENSVKKG